MSLELDGVYMSSDGVSLPIVRKSNLLIESICKATTNEKRIVIMGASKVHKDDPIGKTYSFHLSEIKKYSGIQNKRFYKDLAEAIIGIKRRDLWLKQENGKFVLTNWFSWVDYDDKTLTLKFRFDQSVHEFLTVLGGKFTAYLISNAISLNKSQYITLFELLKSYEYKGNGKKFYREIEISYLSERLNLVDLGYHKFYDIKRFVIEPAVKAINECTDINIYNVEYIKTGRKFTSISFHCEPSSQIRMVVDASDPEPEPTPETPQNEQQIDPVNFIDDDKERELDSIKKELLKHGVITPVAEKLLEEFSTEQIRKNIDYTLEKNAKGKVKGLARYLHDAIINNYAKSSKPLQDAQKKSTDVGGLKNAKQKKESNEEQLLNKEKHEFELAIQFFESLDEVVRNAVLDKVEGKLSKMEKVRFTAARKGNAAHKERTYAFHFKQVLAENGFEIPS